MTRIGIIHKKVVSVDRLKPAAISILLSRICHGSFFSVFRDSQRGGESMWVASLFGLENRLRCRQISRKFGKNSSHFRNLV
ncbi:hypothetical protein HMPREF9374_1823 [Desmospora sp. 8437]|nr:hypothetical protein HMPREF9374_1823 [Desmospora sp. 8437]